MATDEHPATAAPAGKIITSKRFNPLVDAVNVLARRQCTLESIVERIKPKAGTLWNIGVSVAVKVGEQISAGKYEGTAYYGTYDLVNDEDDLDIEHLGGFTIDCVLWNLSEIEGGSMLAEDTVVDATVVGAVNGIPVLKTGGTGSGDWSRGVVRNGVSQSADPDNDYHYDLYAIDGTTLLEADLEVEWEFPAVDHIAAPNGSHAFYFEDSDGFHLVWVPQVIDFDECTEEVVSEIQTTTYSAAIGQIVRADPSGGGFTINLPTAASQGGREILIKNVTTSTNTITIDAAGAETIDGSATATITTSRGSKRLVSDGTNWLIL